MHVGDAFLGGLVEHGVDEPDDRRFVVLVEDVLGRVFQLHGDVGHAVVALFHVVHDLIGARAAVKRRVDRGVQHVNGHQQRLDAHAAKHHAQIVQRVQRQRIGHRDFQDAVNLADRQHLSLAGIAHRDVGDQRRIERRVVDLLLHREAKLLPQRGDQLQSRQRALLHEDLPRQPTALILRLQRRFHRFRRADAAVHEDLANCPRIYHGALLLLTRLGRLL